MALGITFPIRAIIANVKHENMRQIFYYFRSGEKTQRQIDLEKSMDQLPTLKPTNSQS